MSEIWTRSDFGQGVIVSSFGTKFRTFHCTLYYKLRNPNIRTIRKPNKLARTIQRSAFGAVWNPNVWFSDIDCNMYLQLFKQYVWNPDFITSDALFALVPPVYLIVEFGFQTAVWNPDDYKQDASPLSEILTNLEINFAHSSRLMLTLLGFFQNWCIGFDRPDFEPKPSGTEIDMSVIRTIIPGLSAIWTFDCGSMSGLVKHVLLWVHHVVTNVPETRTPFLKRN